MQSTRAIQAIVFDLDGTLYENDGFAAEIQCAAAVYVAGLKNISFSEAEQLMAQTRARLSEEQGTVQTISAVCVELGGTIQELHRFFASTLQPETHLLQDERVMALLERLAANYRIYIYTNNNRRLTDRILRHLALNDFITGIFAIDDTWIAKPDEETLQSILDKAGVLPHQALFVGDRYDIDLRLPEQLGCPVYLSQTMEQLLRLEELLTLMTDADTPKASENPPAVR